jgi:4-hydroxyphenylacetate 3-monooxygenase
MTYETEAGLRASYSYLAPKSAEDLLARRRNTEVWARESYGMMGRYPDFCAGIIVGMYDVRDELAKVKPEFGANITNYLAHARDHDLSLSHGLHDPAMDKSLRPRDDPDRCLRIVKERDDGIVVRGARFVTLGPLTNEVVIAPTYVLREDEAEFALWFAMPVATPGIKQICRTSFAQDRDPTDYPTSTRFDEQDSLVIFDDVLVPWERVFLANAPDQCNKLFRARVMTWASYASVLQLLARIELIIGVGHLLAKTSGTETRPGIIAEMGELVMYSQLFRSVIRAAEVDCVETPGGNISLGPAPHLRALITSTSERIVTILEHIGTSSLIFVPSAEDMAVPELRKYIEIYGRGKGVDADFRQRLCKLAWELTGDSFGGRQQLYERLHSGSPEAVIANVYHRYDTTNAVQMVEKLLSLDPR